MRDRSRCALLKREGACARNFFGGLTASSVAAATTSRRALSIFKKVHHAAHVLGVVTPEEQRRVRDLPMPVVEPPPPRTVRVACAPWVDALPTASDGLFVVGRHALPAMTRSGARLRATVNAHSQAGWATGLGAVALSRGTTLAVQERASCVERTSTGGYRAFMLAFVSDAEQRRIRSISVHPDPSKMESTSVEVR